MEGEAQESKAEESKAEQSRADELKMSQKLCMCTLHSSTRQRREQEANERTLYNTVPIPFHPIQSSMHSSASAVPRLSLNWAAFSRPVPPTDAGKPMLLTTGEKERIFTDAIQSFYYNQRQMLDDDDFDKLKEDLAWEGSPVCEGRRGGVGGGLEAETYLRMGRTMDGEGGGAW